MSRAGYDIGVEIGNLMSHVFVSKASKAIAMVGRIIGMLLLSVGAIAAMVIYGFDLGGGGLVWWFILAAVVGVIFLVGMHFWALLIDEEPKKENE